MITALLLAGGLGTRLGEITKSTPKPLIEIGNSTVLELLIDRLEKAGVERIIVKVHYLPDKILQKVGGRVLYYYEPVLYSAQETGQQLVAVNNNNFCSFTLFAIN